MKLITLLKEIMTLRAIKDKFVDNPEGNRSITPEEYDKILKITGEEEAFSKTPEKRSTYATWLAIRVADKQIKGEDIYKYEEYLKTFDKNKRKFSSSDINAYGKKGKGGKELSDFINKAVEIKNATEKDPSLAKGVSKSDKYSKFKIGEVDGFVVYKIPQGSDDLYNVSCELGSGTEWCTATGKTRDHFDRHISQGSLYIFDNGKGKKYQFHYENNEFMDKNNNSIFSS